MKCVISGQSAKKCKKLKKICQMTEYTDIAFSDLVLLVANCFTLSLIDHYRWPSYFICQIWSNFHLSNMLLRLSTVLSNSSFSVTLALFSYLEIWNMERCILQLREGLYTKGISLWKDMTAGRVRISSWPILASFPPTKTVPLDDLTAHQWAIKTLFFPALEWTC